MKGSNNIFITLIPKKPNPHSLSDYRTISLVGCMHKVLAKVLATKTEVGNW